jgi:Transposase DDE domain group 1
MTDCRPKQLGFPPVAHQTSRADFEGGALSSACGALLVRGVDRPIGLTERLATALHDKRPPSSIDHPLRDLLAQRMYHIASGYADAHDAHSLRHDPLCTLGLERRPLDPVPDWARAPTFSRLAPPVDRKDLERLSRALVDPGSASSAEPPATMVLELAHADDPTQGQQAFALYTQHDRHHGSLPRCIFDGTSQALVTASRRPGPRPPGTEKAMLWVRLLASLRRHWPATPILSRGDRHCATPEVMEGIAPRRWTALVFGLAGQAGLLRPGAPLRQAAQRVPQHRVGRAQAWRPAPPPSRRLDDECRYAAQSWAQPGRVVLQAAVMSAGEKPRFVVTSLDTPTPQRRSEDLYGARGTCEHALKAVKGARRSDRTAATTCLANAMRLWLACAAEVLPHAVRTHPLPPTGRAQAQPSPLMRTLFTIAAQVNQYKDRILLHLPSSCPVKVLCHRGTTLLCAVPVPGGNTS